MKKIFFALFSFCFIFLSCKKELGQGPITYIPQEVRTFFNYKPGSYWVYQDSISGNYDSVECQSVINDTFTYIGKYSKYAYEQMQLNYIKYQPSASYTPYKGIHISTEPAHVIDGVFQINRGGDQFSQSLYFVYPFTVGTRFINEYADTVIISAVLDHYTINSFDFDSVVVSDVLYNQNNSTGNVQYYSVKGIGIIQMKYPKDTANYKLVNYHIE